MPVTLVFVCNSILPVPTVLSSKLLLLAVVSILFPAIRISSVLIGPPNISPSTVKFLCTKRLLVKSASPAMLEVPKSTKFDCIVTSPSIARLPVTLVLLPTITVPLPLALNSKSLFDTVVLM